MGERQALVTQMNFSKEILTVSLYTRVVLPPQDLKTYDCEKQGVWFKDHAHLLKSNKKIFGKFVILWLQNGVSENYGRCCEICNKMVKIGRILISGKKHSSLSAFLNI